MFTNSSNPTIRLPVFLRQVSGASNIDNDSSANTTTKTSRVTFGPVDWHIIDSVKGKSRVYYKGSELRELKRLEMMAVRRAMANSDNGDIESDDLTWRGIEDLRDGTDATQKAKAHATVVAEEWKKQKQAGCTDAQRLRQVSKASSKRDKWIAVKKGQKDAEAAGQKNVNKGTGSRAFDMIQNSFMSFTNVPMMLGPAAC